MRKAGVGFHIDDPITDSRLLMRSAGLFVRAGMSRERALHALTMGGAIILDLQNRIGSLDRGKDADFVLLSGESHQRLYARARNLGRWEKGFRSRGSDGSPVRGRRLRCESAELHDR
jgi:imidazolonepropionase-like amidohydrolase